MIDALVFDFDGLILDTETPDYLSWKETYEQYGCELPLAVWHHNIGSVDFFDPYTHLEELAGEKLDREAVIKARRQRDDELMVAQRILPGVEAYLAQARQLGLKIGLASSSDHAWVDAHLDRLGLTAWFEVVRCRDDVNDRGKPDPAVYLAATEALAVQPGRALALEDSLNGITAAKRAGLIGVVVPNQMTRHMNFEIADFQMNSMADMPLEALIGKLNGRV